MYSNVDNSMHFVLGVFNFALGLTLTIVTIVAMWKIFTKAGIDGWKSVIPFYNGYTIVTKVARKSAIYYFWIPLLGTIIIITVFIPMMLATILGMRGVSDTLALVMLFFSIGFSIWILIISILFNIAIAKNFGKSTGFAIGLIFLPLIFYLILAFGDSKFVYETTKEVILQDNDDEYEYIYVDEDGEEYTEK
ncbi:DUF5684 domain-containing protein [Fusobacterium sp. PH5-44]|uniref:DUF5684 domain-containing protein n=1 Tax=unclassified Fusobacterium TaxID=2648384 RepID=UPI003D190022